MPIVCYDSASPFQTTLSMVISIFIILRSRKLDSVLKKNLSGFMTFMTSHRGGDRRCAGEWNTPNVGKTWNRTNSFTIAPSRVAFSIHVVRACECSLEFHYMV